MNRKLGVALMIVGASMLIWISFTPVPKEKMTSTAEGSSITYHNQPKKEDTTSWIPYLGTIILAGGLLITVTSKRPTITE